MASVVDEDVSRIETVAKLLKRRGTNINSGIAAEIAQHNSCLRTDDVVAHGDQSTEFSVALAGSIADGGIAEVLTHHDQVIQAIAGYVAQDDACGADSW